MDTQTTPTGSQAQPNKDAADFKDKMGSPASASAKETPKDNGEKTPDEKKPASDGTKSDPAAAEKKPDEQQHDWKKRFDGVDQEHKKLSEAHQRTIDANVKLVQKKPSVLDDLAETDPNLADQVTQKAFGHDSYESYKKAKALEDIKESDPEKYETQKRLNTLESREKKRQEESKKAFYKGKEIVMNDYDPKFQKVEEQLRLLNKEFVEAEPQQALEIAYNLAFPTTAKTAEELKKEEEARHLADQAANRGGNSGSQMPTGDKGRFKNPEAKSFNDQFKTLSA